MKKPVSDFLGEFDERTPDKAEPRHGVGVPLGDYLTYCQVPSGAMQAGAPLIVVQFGWP
jgi:hypothetical protein